MLRTCVLGIVLLTLSGCSTFTPYVPAAGDGYGFSEQKIEDNRFQVKFRGNSMTPRERVENSLLFRAAELTLMNGYDYFIIVESETDEKTTYSATSSYYPAFYGRYAYVTRRGRVINHFPYYAYGFEWGYPDRRWYGREENSYAATAYVSMLHGNKPDDETHAFDARQVSDNLRAVIVQSE